MALLAFLFLVPPSRAPEADTFTASDFLTWDKESKVLFMDSAVLMAGSVASLNTKGQGRCIYDWYFSEGVEEVRRSILSTMSAYPDHAPTGVIIAHAQKVCGSLRFNKGG